MDTGAGEAKAVQSCPHLRLLLIVSFSGKLLKEERKSLFWRVAILKIPLFFALFWRDFIWYHSTVRGEGRKREYVDESPGNHGSLPATQNSPSEVSHRNSICIRNLREGQEHMERAQERPANCKWFLLRIVNTFSMTFSYKSPHHSQGRQNQKGVHQRLQLLEPISSVGSSAEWKC